MPWKILNLSSVYNNMNHSSPVRIYHRIFVKPKVVVSREEIEIELKIVDASIHRLLDDKLKIKKITVNEMTSRMKELSTLEDSNLIDVYGDYVRIHNRNVYDLDERIGWYRKRRSELLKKLEAI